MIPRTPGFTLFPYTTLFRSGFCHLVRDEARFGHEVPVERVVFFQELEHVITREEDRLQGRSEEHTSELQSQFHLVCRLLLEKKTKSEDTVCIYASITSCAYP